MSKGGMFSKSSSTFECESKVIVKSGFKAGILSHQSSKSYSAALTPTQCSPYRPPKNPNNFQITNTTTKGNLVGPYVQESKVLVLNMLVCICVQTMVFSSVFTDGGRSNLIFPIRCCPETLQLHPL